VEIRGFPRDSTLPLNKVQFQKGLSGQRFRELYGSEKRCRAALFALRWPKGFACTRCGAGRYSEITNRGLYQCSACRHQVSLTAGTILQSTNLPLTFWFRAMYLIIMSNKGISSIELARRLRVTQTTAWRAKRKLVQVMSEGEADYEVDLTKE
jgi:transposase-like protein